MQTGHYKPSVQLYNVQNVDDKLIKENFVVRLREYDRIWHSIQNASMQYPEQCFIVQGVRGAGKTTILSRLAIGVKEHEKLKTWLIPITFREEEYGVSSLFTFWERVAEELAEDPVHGDLFDHLVAQIAELDVEETRTAFRKLDDALIEHDKKLILFIDNLMDLFGHFSKKDEGQMRETLSLCPNIRIIGGSAVSMDAFNRNDAAFYQFFEVITLKGMKKPETEALLRQLGESVGPQEAKRIDDVLTNEPQRVEAIRRLTDGVPRTIALLFQILIEGPKDSTFGYLEQTIDKVTPLYKHRMDDLSKQQKPIINAIAMNWDAISAKDIASKTRMQSKKVSAQLRELEKQWIVEKVKTSTKNHFYRLRERFFNIWYLMRYGRKNGRQKIMWLTRFFEDWCVGSEFNSRARLFADGLCGDSHPQMALLTANAFLNSKNLDVEDRLYVLKRMEEYFSAGGLENEAQSLIREDDDSMHGALLIKMLVYLQAEDYKKVDVLLSNSPFEMTAKLMYFAGILSMAVVVQSNLSQAEKYLIMSVDKGFIPACFSVAELYFEQGKQESAIEWIEKAMQDKPNSYSYCSATTVLINAGMIERATTTIRQGLVSQSWIEEPNDIPLYTSVLTEFLKAKQINLVERLFEEYDLKDAFKPVYYALMHMMKDKYPDEYLKMGDELKETVDEILVIIEGKEHDKA